jgi:hypothetical protein
MYVSVWWCRTLILIQGSVGIMNCVQIGLCMYLCYHILSAQVITKSMNDNMNYLLMLPIISCAGITWYTWWMRDLSWDLYWVPEAFLLVCLMQVVQVPLGIAGGRLKAPKILLGYENKPFDKHVLRITLFLMLDGD